MPVPLETLQSFFDKLGFSLWVFHVVIWDCFSPQIPVDLFLIDQVILTEGFNQEILFHVDNLQVEHQHGKEGCREKDPVETHQEDA